MSKTYKDQKSAVQHRELSRRRKQEPNFKRDFLNFKRQGVSYEGEHCPECGELTDFHDGFLVCSDCGWIDDSIAAFEQMVLNAA